MTLEISRLSPRDLEVIDQVSSPDGPGSVLYSESNVPLRHSSFRPKDNFLPEWADTYDAFKKIILGGGVFALLGGRGTGKTQIGTCLIGHVCFNLMKRSYYIKAFDVFVKIRTAMRSDSDSESAAVRFFVNPFFLVIDACEVRGDTEFENRSIDHIIDKRYDLCKSTLLISNDTAKVFSKKCGASIVDRMKETGGICEVGWESFRGKK